MNDFKFTKALLKQSSANTPSNLHSMTDMARIERIHDNMSGINPITKEVMDKSFEKKPLEKCDNNLQESQLRDQINALNQLKRTND